MVDYDPVIADERLEHAVRCLVRLAIDEDLGDAVDWTTVCLIDPERRGGCQIVAARSRASVPDWRCWVDR